MPVNVNVLKTLRGFTNVDVCTKVESSQFRFINALPHNVFQYNDMCIFYSSLNRNNK